ncbi:hypothetical protein R1flu_020091 [Riccia fluitans]|uniref:DUF7875 domain-containing protein n=1 Tax=Riccia fluitans TaxID=41844 RepID=A0ABD1ZKT1_9MARC
MALRQILGESHGELMREDAVPCSRITKAYAAIASVGGFFCSWPLCVIYYGPRMTRPRLLRSKENFEKNYSSCRIHIFRDRP